MHDGHMYFFQRAKEYGDILYVCVVPDHVVVKNKGHMPVMSQRERVQQVELEDVVDSVIALVGGDEAIKQILAIPPHIYCFGLGQYPEEIEWNSKLKRILEKNIPGVEIYNIEALDRERFNSTRIRNSHRNP